MEDAVTGSIGLFTYWGMRVLTAVLILVAGNVIGNWVAKIIRRINALEETLQTFLGGLAKYAILAIAVVTVLGQFGVQTASLIAVLGAAGLAIGLALQGTLSNVAAGVMLLILRPFRVGDFVTVGAISGTVKSLGLFGTELATSDNVYIFVPNSKMWNSDIMNFTRNTTRRQDFPASISYDDDMDKAMKVLKKLVDGEKRFLDTEGKEPQIMVSNLGDFSVDIIIRAWCRSSDYWQLKWDMTKAIKETLDKNGLSIPFPTQTVVVDGDAPKAEKAKKAAPVRKKAA